MLFCVVASLFEVVINQRVSAVGCLFRVVS